MLVLSPIWQQNCLLTASIFPFTNHMKYMAFLLKDSQWSARFPGRETVIQAGPGKETNLCQQPHSLGRMLPSPTWATHTVACVPVSWLAHQAAAYMAMSMELGQTLSLAQLLFLVLKW